MSAMRAWRTAGAFLAALLSTGAPLLAGEALTLPLEMPASGQGAELAAPLGTEGPSAMAFDSRNRPYLFHSRDASTSGYLVTLRDGQWVRRSFVEAIKKASTRFVSFAATPKERHLHAQGSMTIDDADGLYAIVYCRGAKGGAFPVLVYSADLGETFTAYELPGSPGGAFLETRVGCNDLSAPPAIGLLKLRQRHPAEWTDYHVLSVLVPRKDGKTLRLPPPVEVSSDCFGVSNHSGGYSFAVTRGGRTHLVWAEIPQEGKKGNPTFAATLDRESGKIVERQFLATAPPDVPDVHSTPVIAADAAGRLHVICGAHGQSFLYLRSQQPGRVDAGWTKPVAMGGRQTYATLLWIGKDSLLSAFREWKDGVATLSMQSKPAGADRWPASRTLVVAPGRKKGYGIFYHRLFVDRGGVLYLSFTFFTFRDKGETFYPRLLIASGDGGATWSPATREDLAARVKASR